MSIPVGPGHQDDIHIVRLDDRSYLQHADAMLAILNHAIVHTTAVYEYDRLDRAWLDRWAGDRLLRQRPVLVALKGNDQLCGYASYGTFRDRPCYQHTVEHSLYVDADRRGMGIGRELLHALLSIARESDVHVMIGAVDASNDASKRLHERCGFSHVGTLQAVGRKFDRWLDLALYQIGLEDKHASEA